MVNTISVALVVFLRYKTSKKLSVWMQKRREKGHTLNGLWEFPGGKVEKDETSSAAARREVWEEVGVEIKRPTFFKLYQNQYGEKIYNLSVYIDSDTMVLPLDQNRKWFHFSCEKKSQYLTGKIPTTNHKILDDIITQYAS